MRSAVPFVALAVLVLMPLAAGCSGSSAADRAADERFGHRFRGTTPDGRETVLITAPADSVRYLLYPAVVDSVSVRPERPLLVPGETTPIEVLVKGALPDACAQLDAIEQRRADRYVTVTLQMRQPRERVCAAVVRPFRFYMSLVGEYAPGSYVLTLNGTVVPFQVRQQAAEE